MKRKSKKSYTVMKKILYVTATVLMVYIHCSGSRQAAEAFTTALPEIPASEEPSASFLGWQEIDGAQYYFSPETGEMQTGWLELGEKQYYFSPDTGQMQTGWKKINKQYYFFTISESEKGVLKKNCIAGTKKSGYYYVGKDGVRTDSFEINAAVQYGRSHTKAGWPADKKLSACYESLRNDYTYRHFDGVPKGAELSDCAHSLFKNSLGNCYRYASGFACIAAVLGYPAKVSTGKVTSVYGGWAEHGWAQVLDKEKWKLCDIGMKQFMTDRHPWRSYVPSAVYRLTVKNGKAAWVKQV
jgi:FOG: Glucan-binding domain (YG repeat)